MSSSSVKTIGGAGSNVMVLKKGSTEKQRGNFTPLQLNAVNQFTVQVVHTSVLHESSRGWNRISNQIGHYRWSRMAELLVLVSGTSRLGVQCMRWNNSFNAGSYAVNCCWATSWMCLCMLVTSFRLTDLGDTLSTLHEHHVLVSFYHTIHPSSICA